MDQVSEEGHGRFPRGKATLLVTSDLASADSNQRCLPRRELDVPAREADAHRAGRTARAGRKDHAAIGDELELPQLARWKEVGIVSYPNLYRGGIRIPEP
jgi:superfamily II DNA/RNA helicase